MADGQSGAPTLSVLSQLLKQPSRTRCSQSHLTLRHQPSISWSSKTRRKRWRVVAQICNTRRRRDRTIIYGAQHDHQGPCSLDKKPAQDAHASVGPEKRLGLATCSASWSQPHNGTSRASRRNDPRTSCQSAQFYWACIRHLRWLWPSCCWPTEAGITDSRILEGPARPVDGLPHPPGRGRATVRLHDIPCATAT